MTRYAVLLLLIAASQAKSENYLESCILHLKFTEGFRDPISQRNLTPIDDWNQSYQFSENTPTGEGKSLQFPGDDSIAINEIPFALPPNFTMAFNLYVSTGPSDGGPYGLRFIGSRLPPNHPTGL